MIDLTIDQPYEPAALCECGDPECLGSAEAVNAVVAALSDALPQLDSPILRLVKERNEARELVQRMMLAVEGAPQAEYYATMLAAHRALQAWKGGAQ
jgi:hypothetical protein